MKQVRRSDEAQKDIDGIVVHYSRESLVLANRFIRQYETSIRAIAAMPGRGSPRFGNELGIPDLRTYAMRDFPYLVFYRDHIDAIDIDRVLHSHRDVFRLLTGSND